ncbi:hypothetical protein BMETH_147_7 [methanotrophic bacterial endosymbiont of Bathymodiolus sp.]|nr:hypothetical protein BMETH_147_7 [methanotrophic bacterial endosymbiont of Bathymodiolus sp.]
MTIEPKTVCGPETPPRAWGRRKRVKKMNNMERNTPTGVGKTTRAYRSCDC